MSPTLPMARSAPPPQRHAYQWASLGPFAILAIAASVLAEHWSRIPPRFAVHWGLNGVANGWSVRSFWGVFGSLLIAALFCLLTAFLGYATLHWAQHPRGGFRPDHRRGTAWSMLAASYVLAIVFAATALLPLRGAAHGPPAILPLLLAVVIPLAIAVLIIFAWRSQPATGPAAASPPRERTHAGHWVAGFYYNPDDPAILVPKRFGYGYTFNMAHRMAWLMFGAIGAAVTVALVLSAAAH